MIEFNLERALAGDPVVTRDGRKVTQLVKFETESGGILLGLDVGNDYVDSWLIDGRYRDGGECGADLFMAPKKLSGFVNVFACEGGSLLTAPHNTRENADTFIVENSLYRVACIDLSTIEEGHGL